LHYELPQELPDRLLTLLMELIGREENGRRRSQWRISDDPGAPA
jgi:hypothetical protein